MRRAAICLLLPFALIACGDDDGAPPPDGQTLAYVLTECSEGPQQGFVGSQKLLIQRGDADPVTVAEVPTFGPVPQGRGLCTLFGENAVGLASVILGAFQRIGMSSDGSLLFFEVTDDHSILHPNHVPPEQEGIWVVRTDGSDLRRIGDASRNPCFRFQDDPVLSEQEVVFGLNRDASRLTFTDRGPGPGGDAEQIFTMDVATGMRGQLTQLPLATVEPGRLPVAFPGFLDADTIVFVSRANPVIDGDESNPNHERRIFTVKTNDPHRLKAVPSFAEPGNAGTIIETFQITGPEPVARVMPVMGMPVNACGQYGCSVFEAFVLDRERVLQLTNFQRSDTGGVVLTSADRDRIYFYASADPLGTNRFNNCQLFSIDRTGADLRQLTNFDVGEESEQGCKFVGGGAGCFISVSALGQDPATRSILFASSCDPFGTNPNGSQVFTVRPDGTGLRQLTHARGTVTAPDGTVTVELPGPYASPLGY